VSELTRRAPHLLSRAAAFATGVVLIAAGCGDGANSSSRRLSKTQYEHKVQQIQQEVFAKVNPATVLLGARGGDPGPGLRAVQVASAKEADELDRLRPPAEIAHPHRSLVMAIRRYGNDLNGIIAAVRKHELRGRRLQAKLRSLASIKAIRTARREIAQKGYDIG
jgi:hypothetical protein